MFRLVSVLVKHVVYKTCYTLRPLSHKRMCSILDQRHSFTQMSRRALLIDADSGMFGKIRVRLCTGVEPTTFRLRVRMLNHWAIEDFGPLNYRPMWGNPDWIQQMWGFGIRNPLYGIQNPHISMESRIHFGATRECTTQDPGSEGLLDSFT